MKRLLSTLKDNHIREMIKVMKNIRPLSDLVEHYDEISDICKGTKNPVFLEEEGEKTLVALDIKEYLKLLEKANPADYDKLSAELDRLSRKETSYT